MSRRVHRTLHAFVALGMLALASSAHGQLLHPAAMKLVPTPADPYPLVASGWASATGRRQFASRWVEDWTGLRALGLATPLKDIQLGRASLTLSGEARLRFDRLDDAALVAGNDLRQGLFRGVGGADLRFTPNVRLYAEVATGLVDRRRETSPVNMRNDASLQQLFVDVRGNAGSHLLGAMLGRQEFADAPRQLLGISDNPNIHRTWNGVRLYAHGARARYGAFALRITHLAAGAFDERVDSEEALRGVNASFVLTPAGDTTALYLDPFWMRSVNPAFSSGGRSGFDRRDNAGARVWGRMGKVSVDWTLVGQRGTFAERDVRAWGLFAVQSAAISPRGWAPRLTSHVDVASGGGAYTSGSLSTFNQLYTASSYLGEGQFLSLANLLMIAPGIAVTPTSRSSLAAEIGFASRLHQDDAVYGAGMRAYPGTQNVSGHTIGTLFRLTGSLAASEYVTVFMNADRLAAGDVLERAGLPSGSQAYLGVTLRY